MNYKPLLLALAAPCFASFAQDIDTDPIITIHSHRYETAGGTDSAAAIQFSLISTEETTIKVDLGDGFIRSYAIDPDGQIGVDDYYETLTGGTTIQGILGPSGTIRVWGDATKFDYFDIHGSEVYDIDIEQLVNLEILSLSHNAIRKLDLSMMPRLQYIDVADNTFEEGFTLGDNHPYLFLLNVNQMGDNALPSGTIEIHHFPYLEQFTAWDSRCLTHLDVTQNPALKRISVDNTGLKSLDVTQNSELLILNVSDCGFNQLDVTQNPKLQELYVDNQSSKDDNHRLSTLDITQNPYLYRLFMAGNALTTVDMSQNTYMQSVYAANNRMNHLDVSMLDYLNYLEVPGNCFDFVTLPTPSDNAVNVYYDYDLQQPWPVDAEYAVGMTLDLSSRTERPGTETYCALYTQSIDHISNPVELTEGIDYTYSNGKITFLREQSDEVFCAFINSLLEFTVMETTPFKVRKAEDYGKPVTLFTLTPSLAMNEGEIVTFAYTCDGENIEVAKTYHSRPIEIKGAIGSHVTSLRVQNVPLQSIDLTRLYDLKSLDIIDCGLTDIDLSWNNSLEHIDLSGNALTVLDLSAVNAAYNKNVLTDVVACDNNIASFTASEPSTLWNLVLSNNKLETVNLTDMTNLQTLKLDGNLLTELMLNDCAALRTMNVNGNRLPQLDVTPCTSLTRLEAKGNRMKFSTMPTPAEGLELLLAPQEPVIIASHSSQADLSSENYVNDSYTAYTWINATTGAALVEGTDYTISNGLTLFNTTMEGTDVYCQMENATYADFTGEKALRTTTMTVTGQPKYLVAEFTTPVGEQEGVLSLAASKPDTYIYMDWGNGELKEYALQTTYQLFQGTTIQDGKVRVWSNDAPDGNITIFSISNIAMADIDLSKMSQLYCLTLENAGLDEVDITHNPAMRELSLGGNHLSEIDLNNAPELTFLYLANNQFTSLDLSGCHELGWLQAPSNQLTSINVAGLNKLWNIDVTDNLLETIDVTQVPDLNQLFVAENYLHEIDLSQNHQLYVVNLNDNFFDLSTLPIPTWNVYFYANQAPLKVTCVDGKIDLSSQKMAGDCETTFYWFIGELEFDYDEDGNLTLLNGELIEGEDYTVEDGVCTFRESWPLLTGYLSNETFPDMLLFTEPVSVTVPSGIETIHNDAQEGMAHNAIGQPAKASDKGLVISKGKVNINK